jgi:hypothetical protein
MKIDFKTLWHIIDKPDGGELAIVRRHYCTQMNLHDMCTTLCVENCALNIKRAFAFSRGEFIVNKHAALVGSIRQVIYDVTQREHKAITPVNNFTEPIPEGNVFEEIARQYEGKT